MNARVDALWIAVGLRVDPLQLVQLQRAKADARAGGGTAMIAGEVFAVDAIGKRGKPFALENPSGLVFVSDREVVVQVSVPFLAVRSVAGCVVYVMEIASALCAAGAQITRAEVRRVDLCADLAGATFTAADGLAFVCRGANVTDRGTEKTRAIEIGDLKALSLIVYNKSLQLSRARDAARVTLEHDGWSSNGWTGRGDVWRVEFKVRGRALKAYGLRDVGTLAGQIDPAWQAFTRRAFRLVSRGTATRRERCLLDPRWEAVRGAVFVREGVEPAERRAATAVGAKLGQAVGMLASALVSRDLSRGEIEKVLEHVCEVAEAPDERAKVSNRLDRAYARLRGAA